MTARTQREEPPIPQKILDWPDWPPRPSIAAYNLEGLNMAIYDLVHGEGARGIGDDRRVYLQLAAVTAAAELYAHLLARFFSTRMGDDHELLEDLEERFI